MSGLGGSEVAETEAHLRGLIDAQGQAFADFDRTILTLSSGALAISLVFVHNVAPHPHQVGWLVWSWAMFGSSLIAILCSYMTSQMAHKVRIERLYKTKADTDTCWSPATWLFNILAAMTFVSGVGLLIEFAASNIH